MALSKDFREILTSEIISVTGGLVAGIMLASAVDKIYLIPGILILIPGFLEMRGNISGSLSARLSSGLIIGAVKPHIKRNRVIRGNVIASVALVILLSLVLGVVSYMAVGIFFGIYNTSLIAIALIAGLLSNLIEIPLTIFFTFWLFRHKYDPENIMGPYITTTGDIISILSLLFAVLVI